MQRIMIALVCFLTVWPATYVQAAEPEFRGVWVARFGWPDEDADKCKQNITRILDTIEANNFNAVVFQVRGEAETLYPSEIEPWSSLFGEKDPGFDPLAFAIKEAHKRGIELHAYVNPIPLRTAKFDAPSDPRHLWHAHGPGSDEPWVTVDKWGEPVVSSYYYLSAGIPGVHEYLRRVMRDLASRYDVDGIHLDRIRYPGPGTSHDAISTRRFRGRGNPNRLEWYDWQREQLDKLINDIAAEVRAEDPGIRLSCAAWGIYNRYHVPGYAGFSSGFHDYYQDTWSWVRLGAMDTLMPMIYWNLHDPKPNYDELLKDFVEGIGPEHFVGGQRVFGPEENARQIELTREAGAVGTVLWQLGRAEQRGVMDHLKQTLYKDKASVPKMRRVTDPTHGVVLGTVLADDGEPLVDAWVSVAPVDDDAPSAPVFSKTWTSGLDGRFAFLNVPPGRVKVTVRYPGAQTTESKAINVRAGRTSDTALTVAGSAEARNRPMIDIMSPRLTAQTTGEVTHVLGRTEPGNTVTVDGNDAEVYATGAFAADNLPLVMGQNKIEVIVTSADGSIASAVIVVDRVEPEPRAPRKDLAIDQPARDLAIYPGQVLAVRVKGPPARSGYVVCFAGKVTTPLTEQLNDGGEPSGIYTAVIKAPAGAVGTESGVRVVLKASGDDDLLRAEAPGKVQVWDPVRVRVGEATDDAARISYGLHGVRLGGPYVTEAPAGTRFEIIGRQGQNFKIRLSGSLSGWIPVSQVRQLPEGTPPPHNYFTYCQITGDEQVDRLFFPVSEKVVFAVNSITEPGNALHIDFFNTHDAMTWISHKSSAQIIGNVTGRQIEDDWYRVTVPIESKQIWGYWSEVGGDGVSVYVRRPPQIAAAPDSSLKGQVIAVEAGHGGSNSGAVGRMGTKEKSVNLAAVTAIAAELKARGAQVELVRRGDSSPGLSERAEHASDSGAVFFLSVHANSAGSGRGFLRVSGTSVYYKHQQSRRAAELIYDNVLALDWDDFGLVGNFNYSPLRNTRMPAVLLEQAFMSHPGDEARLLDPEYQQAQAEAVVEAIERFFDEGREP